MIYVWHLTMTLWAAKIILVARDDFFSAMVLPVGLIVFSSLVLILRFSQVKFFFRGPRLIFFLFGNIFLLFSLMAGLLYGVSLSFGVSVYTKFLLFQILFLFGFISSCCNATRRGFLIYIYLGVLLHLIFGAFSPLLGFGYEVDGLERYSGLTGKVNILANFGLFISLYCLPFIVRGFDKKYFSLFLLAVFIVFLTGTLKNVFVLFGVFSLFVLRRMRNFFIAIPILLFIAIPVFFALYPGSVVDERVQQLVSTGISADLDRGEKVGNSLNWRIMHWRFLLEDWLSGYSLSGAGLGGYSILNGLTTNGGAVFDPHNDWIKLLLEFGLLGFPFFLYIWLVMAKTLLYYSTSPHCLGLFLAFCGLSVAMLGGPVIFSLPFFYFFLPMAGYFISTEKRRRVSNSFFKLNGNVNE